LRRSREALHDVFLMDVKLSLYSPEYNGHQYVPAKQANQLIRYELTVWQYLKN
jgi:hypothetical protein